MATGALIAVIGLIAYVSAMTWKLYWLAFVACALIGCGMTLIIRAEVKYGDKLDELEKKLRRAENSIAILTEENASHNCAYDIRLDDIANELKRVKQIKAKALSGTAMTCNAKEWKRTSMCSKGMVEQGQE